MPVEGVNLAPGECDAIGVLFANAFSRDAHVVVMSPLETQVREHHMQLRRRLESIKRIHHASDELEERIAELQQQEAAVKLQIMGLMQEVSAVDAIVMYPDTLPLAANA